jgi:hypothetical protein
MDSSLETVIWEPALLQTSYIPHFKPHVYIQSLRSFIWRIHPGGCPFFPQPKEAPCCDIGPTWHGCQHLSIWNMLAISTESVLWFLSALALGILEIQFPFVHAVNLLTIIWFTPADVTCHVYHILVNMFSSFLTSNIPAFSYAFKLHYICYTDSCLLIVEKWLPSPTLV